MTDLERTIRNKMESLIHDAAGMIDVEGRENELAHCVTRYHLLYTMLKSSGLLAMPYSVALNRYLALAA